MKCVANTFVEKLQVATKEKPANPILEVATSTKETFANVPKAASPAAPKFQRQM